MYPENDYRTYLEHSAKGQKWKSHKYLYKTASGRYVYPEDNALKAAKKRVSAVSGDLFDKFYANMWQTSSSYNNYVKKLEEERENRKARPKSSKKQRKIEKISSYKSLPFAKQRGKQLREDIANWMYKDGKVKKARLARLNFRSKTSKPVTGASLSSSTNYNDVQRKTNENLDRQDRNSKSVKTKKRVSR